MHIWEENCLGQYISVLSDQNSSRSTDDYWYSRIHLKGIVFHHLFMITVSKYYHFHDKILPWQPQMHHQPWASCQIREIAGAHAPGMPRTFSPPPRVRDPDMHHGTCVTHVPWCMPGSLTSGFLWNRRRGKTFPAFPAHAQPAILRIW